MRQQSEAADRGCSGIRECSSNDIRHQFHNQCRCRARLYTPATVRQIPAGQRVTDITTSLTMSLAAAALVTTAVHLATDMLPNAADVAFFGTVTLMAAWALIVPAKMWEGRTGDTIVRRLIQGSLGLGVGAVAAILQQFLMLNESPLLHTDGDGVFNGGTIGRHSYAAEWSADDGRIYDVLRIVVSDSSLVVAGRQFSQDSFSNFVVSGDTVSGCRVVGDPAVFGTVGRDLGIGDFGCRAVVVRVDSAGRSTAFTGPGFRAGRSDAGSGSSPGRGRSGCGRSKM